MSANDFDHMRRAIALARARLGKTWPNPAVGCVIARGERVLAEAATGEGGRPHAEEQALAAAGELDGAVAYVTLEPCGARSNGAPSCADLLAASAIGRVVIACEDPSPFASGQGLERLHGAGLTVEVGLLGDEAAVLSAGFVHRLTTGRPLVEAADGPDGFDAMFQPEPGEALAQALQRMGDAGLTRLWTPRGGVLARALAENGLLSAQADRKGCVKG